MLDRFEQPIQSLLVFGLGNPGAEYEQTRHNVGFLVADELSIACRIPLRETARHSVYGKGEWKGHPIWIVKPTTYMNRSGRAVVELLSKIEADMSQVLVVCDDINLQLGQLRIRTQGSAGGQKGLKSIIESLGTQEFSRLRMGIGPAPSGLPLEDYVLDDFLASEQKLVDPMIDRARQAIQCLLEEGIEATMGRFNQRLDNQVS